MILNKQFDIHNASRQELFGYCQKLENAINHHRKQKSDDRCWLDDLELYAVLGDDVLPDNSLPCKEKFLNNCSRYYDNRCKDGNWESYQELEEKLNKIKQVVLYGT